MKKNNISREFIEGKSGHLLIIGGGQRPDYMMEEFIRLSGGCDSQITILPVASLYPELRGQEIKSELESLGCTHVNYICAANGEIDNEINLEKLELTKGVFFTGGDQNILARLLLKTQVLERIKEIYLKGGAIGGTSAGAATMSKVMIAGYDPDFDDSETLLFHNPYCISNAKLSEGFGFLNNIIIDQHFNTRPRTERLKDAVKKNPGMIGLGIDESTAIIVHSDHTFQVIGENKVTLFSVVDIDLVRKMDKVINPINSGQIQTLGPGEKYLFNNYTKN